MEEPSGTCSPIIFNCQTLSQLGLWPRALQSPAPRCARAQGAHPSCAPSAVWRRGLCALSVSTEEASQSVNRSQWSRIPACLGCTRGSPQRIYPPSGGQLKVACGGGIGTLGAGHLTLAGARSTPPAMCTLPPHCLASGHMLHTFVMMKWLRRGRVCKATRCHFGPWPLSSSRLPLAACESKHGWPWPSRSDSEPEQLCICFLELWLLHLNELPERPGRCGSAWDPAPGGLRFNSRSRARPWVAG